MNNFLTDLIRQDLRARHRKERDRRVADRIKAILLADDGWTYKQIATALLLDEETISRHIQEYLDSHKLKPENGGSESKLNASQTSELMAHLKAKAYMKVADIVQYVKQTYGISYTLSGMTYWLHAHGFSYKKPAATPSKANPEMQEIFIQYYENLLKTTPEDEPLLFGDGVHPTMATKITYGWIRKGMRQTIATTASRTRINVMGSLDLARMAVYATPHETLDSRAMKEHFQHLRELYPKAPRIHMIVDRGPYNISRETQKAAVTHSIVLHYLPPYSPNLNPIERCWKIMNEQVRNNRFFASAKEFREAIMHFFNTTWPDIATSMTDRVNDNFQRLKSIPSF